MDTGVRIHYIIMDTMWILQGYFGIQRVILEDEFAVSKF